MTLLLMLLVARAGDYSTLYKAGHFDEALAACEAALRQKPNNPEALTAKGRILLIQNRVSEATITLAEADRVQPNDTERLKLEAEAAYRQGDYATAADLETRAGRLAKAKQLESFGARQPYRIEGLTSIDEVAMVNTDPLPLVHAIVNGKPANLLIDTGAGETILDPEFAQSIGVQSLGEESGVFGGDKRSGLGLGRLGSLKLGKTTIHDLPVNLLDTRRFSAAANGLTVDGIVGTGLFYHLTATLDYPNHRLILRPRGVAVRAHDSIPFWLAGDHFMVAWGRIESSAPHLFLVDTGLAGAAFAGSTAVMREIGAKTSMENAPQGIGGGGAMPIVPFTISHLSLGPAEQKSLTGIYGPFPESFADSLGFNLSGIISHQFFRPYAVTFDFSSMQIRLEQEPLMNKKTLALLALSGITAVAPAQTPKPSKNLSDTMAFFVKSYNKKEYPAISKHLGAALTAALPPAKAAPFFANVYTSVGKIKSYSVKSVISADHAKFAAVCEHQGIEVEMQVGAKGIIELLALRPMAPKK